MLKCSYDFNKQILTMQDIVDSNIRMAEAANTCLKSIKQNIISKAVQELKEEYEQTFKNEDEKLTSIKTTLNLAARENVTNIDELFMNLSEEINTYYKKKLLNPQKMMPYFKKCQKCNQHVTNDNLGLKWHQEKCKGALIELEKPAPQRKNKKKQIDTKQKYQQRQQLMPNLLLHSEDSPPSQIHNQRKPNKKQRLHSKKITKHLQNINKYMAGEKIHGSSESIFMSQDQHSIIEQPRQPQPDLLKVEFKHQANNENAQGVGLENEDQDLEFFS